MKGNIHIPYQYGHPWATFGNLLKVVWFCLPTTRTFFSKQSEWRRPHSSKNCLRSPVALCWIGPTYVGRFQNSSWALGAWNSKYISYHYITAPIHSTFKLVNFCVSRSRYLPPLEITRSLELPRHTQTKLRHRLRADHAVSNDGFVSDLCRDQRNFQRTWHIWKRLGQPSCTIQWCSSTFPPRM